MKNKEKVREVLANLMMAQVHESTCKDDDERILNRALAALESLLEQEQDGWIPVGERLPEDNVDVLGFCDGIGNHIFTYSSEYGWTLNGFDGVCGIETWEAIEELAPTHWQPLPALPKTEAGE